MRSFVSVSALLALLASTTAFAANMTIPMSFEYLALDGKQIETNIFNHKSKLNLTTGTHKIAIRYHDMVEDKFSDSQSFIKSAPFIITLEVTGDYNFLLTPEQTAIKDPKKFAKSPKVSISRGDKGSVSYKIEQTDFKEDTFLAKLFNPQSTTNVAQLSSEATGLSNNPTPTNISIETNDTSVQAINHNLNDNLNDGQILATAKNQQVAPEQAEQMLQYWWLKADDKTRKEFMSWAISQL